MKTVVLCVRHLFLDHFWKVVTGLKVRIISVRFPAVTDVLSHAVCFRSNVTDSDPLGTVLFVPGVFIPGIMR